VSNTLSSLVAGHHQLGQQARVAAVGDEASPYRAGVWDPERPGHNVVKLFTPSPLRVKISTSVWPCLFVDVFDKLTFCKLTISPSIATNIKKLYNGDTSWLKRSGFLLSTLSIGSSWPRAWSGRLQSCPSLATSLDLETGKHVRPSLVFLVQFSKLV